MNSKEITAEPAGNRSKESLRTWLRLLSCETIIEQQLRSLMRKQFSVTLPQFDVIAELDRAGKQLTMSELSEKLMVSNGNVTGVIDRLERNGLVKRSRAEHDRRIQNIRLTAKGRDEFNEVAAQHERWLNEMFDDLTMSDMTSLQDLLLKTRNSVS